MNYLSQAQKDQFVDMIYGIQDRLCAALEKVDGEKKFQLKEWKKPETLGGGGRMAVLRGNVVEKAGVNVSAVSGAAYPAIEGEHRGKPFFAAGVSTIAHMMNPYAPIGHMNVRILDVGDTFWVGGGADLTPFMKFDQDTEEFHESLRKSCEYWPDADAYNKFKTWCDEYFYIAHRKEIRGVGGVFFDYLKNDFERCYAFTRAVAESYADVYPRILTRRKDMPFTESEKDGQLYWRGRYAEFNLVYDRGTKFGLMTGGNTEAILVSMPPVVKW